MAGKPISITKTTPLGKGKHLGTVESIELVEDKEINYYGKSAVRDVLEVTLNINGNIKTKDMIFTMSENSQLGKLIKAIKGYIPEEIYSLEEELVGKEVMVDIDTNTKDGYTHYNIKTFESVENQSNSYNNTTSTDQEDMVAEDEEDYGYDEEFEDELDDEEENIDLDDIDNEEDKEDDIDWDTEDLD